VTPGQGPLTLDLGNEVGDEVRRGRHVEDGVGEEGLAEGRRDGAVEKVRDFSFPFPLKSQRRLEPEVRLPEVR